MTALNSLARQLLGNFCSRSQITLQDPLIERVGFNLTGDYSEVEIRDGLGTLNDAKYIIHVLSSDGTTTNTWVPTQSGRDEYNRMEDPSS